MAFKNWQQETVKGIKSITYVLFSFFLKTSEFNKLTYPQFRYINISS